MSLDTQITVVCRLTVDRGFREAFTQMPDEALTRYGYNLRATEREVIEEAARLFAQHPELAENIEAVGRPCHTHFPATFHLAQAELGAEVDLVEAFVASKHCWRPGETWTSAQPHASRWEDKANLREQFNYTLDCFYLFIRDLIEQGRLQRACLSDVLEYEYDCYRLPLELYPRSIQEAVLPAGHTDFHHIYPKANPFVQMRTYNYPVTTITAHYEDETCAFDDAQPRIDTVLFGYGHNRFVKLNLSPVAKEIWLNCDGCHSVADITAPFSDAQPVLKFLKHLTEYGLIETTTKALC
jgi:hypothetical protein